MHSPITTFFLSLNYVYFSQSLLLILIISITENSVCTGEILVSPFRFWQNLGSTLLEYGQSMDVAPLSKKWQNLCVPPKKKISALPVITPEQSQIYVW